MSATLPTIDGQCCLPVCDDVVVQNIPGPAGDDGADGAAGADGVSATTTLTIAFTMPAELASDTATVVSTAGLVIGQNVYVQGLGILQVAAILGPTQATLTNLEDTPNSAYASNAAPGTIASIGSRIGPGGVQGPAGLLAGTPASGDLKGFYPGPTLAIGNGLGAVVVGNGIDSMALSAGTNGQILAYDSAQPLGMLAKSVLPITGGTNVADNRIARLDGATGLPIPMQSSKVEINDAGAISAVGSNVGALGDPRGLNAVDLQVTRAGAGQVASGARSFIGGGQNNGAPGTECVVAGGENNIAGAVGLNHSVVAGGSGNSATGQESFVGGGQGNAASNSRSTVAGGDTNIADGAEAFIGGGLGNNAHGPDSVIGGGVANTATAGKAGEVVGGGQSNVANGNYATVAGGQANTAGNDFASILGGKQASADKYGQRAYSAGMFTAVGDCQHTELVWRCQTLAGAVNIEMFLDGSAATQRATIPVGKTWVYEIFLIGRSSTGLSAAWLARGCIANNAGTTAIVGIGIANTLIGDGTGSTWGTLGNCPVVAADNATDSLTIKVNDATASNIRWAAVGKILEIGF